MSDIAIEISNISKRFSIWHEHKITHHDILTKNQEKVTVADGVSFAVHKGDIFGIMGRNGSGKTTLLKIISGIYQADSGAIKVNGTLVPLLEVGAGFQTELSAVENIITYGLILGLKKKEIENKVDAILEFSELEQFRDTSLKKFSTGMQSRLAISTAMQIEPDIILIDEILAVGDIAFRTKCYDHFTTLKQKGKTVVLVSHKLDEISKFCNKAVFLERGKIVTMGEPVNVIASYRKALGLDKSNSGMV